MCQISDDCLPGSPGRLSEATSSRAPGALEPRCPEAMLPDQSADICPIGEPMGPSMAPSASGQMSSDLGGCGPLRAHGRLICIRSWDAELAQWPR